MSSTSADAVQAPGKARTPRFPVIFAVIAAGVAMSNLDLFVVNVAIPDIGASFRGASLSSVSWVLNGYAVIFAALLVPAGSYADRTSPRRAYLTGIGVFTAASAVCAVAPNLWVLVGARLIQAAGAALLIPASLGILLATAPEDKRLGAVRNWAALTALAAAIGPALGGLLTQVDWRWVFLINLPIGVATILSGRILPATARRTDGARGDLLGALLLILGIGALALGLVQAQYWGWGSLRQAIALAAAACLVASFFWRSATNANPVLPLKLLNLPGIRLTLVANLLFAVVFSCMLLSVVLWCQEVWHWSALRTGLAIVPGPLMVPLLSRYAGLLVNRFGPGVVAIAGCAFFAGGIVWWAVVLTPGDHSYPVGLLPGMLLTGVGVCLALPTLIGAAVRRLPGVSFSTGSAIVSMARQIGSVLGVAGFVAVLDAAGSGPVPSVTAFDRGWEFTAAVTALTLVSCCALLRRNPGPR
jgi:EmrB/QacA subfamily drug resistance transporter